MPQKQPAKGDPRGRRAKKAPLPPPPRARQSGPKGGKGKGRARSGAVNVFGSSDNRGRDRVSFTGLNSGFTLRQSRLRMGDGTQKHSLMGSCDSVRVRGCDVSILQVGQQVANVFGMYNSASAGWAASWAIAPREISARLAAIAGMYQYYAIRELNLRFVPLVGPAQTASTTSTGSNDMIAIALNGDYASTIGADGPTSFQEVAQTDPSVIFPAWLGGQLSYRFNGEKLWYTSTNNSSTDPDTSDSHQAALSGIWFATPSLTGTSRLTHLVEVDYVIDLYRPQEPTSHPSVSRPLGPLAPPPLSREQYVRVEEESDEKDPRPSVPNSPAPSRRTQSLPRRAP